MSRPLRGVLFSTHFRQNIETSTTAIGAAGDVASFRDLGSRPLTGRPTDLALHGLY